MVHGAVISSARIDSSEVMALNIRKSITIFFAALCMVILILDTRTGIAGASAGIDICIKALVPSLFPFFILSILLTNALVGQSLRILRPIAKFCRIPAGSESLLAIGFLGGYPVGVQNIAIARGHGTLSKEDAERMVALCNNAGPAFIFGFLGPGFENALCPWILWITHILSALLVGHILPGGNKGGIPVTKPHPISLSDALDSGLRVMARVCGWVILFRIVLEFLQKWFFFALPYWMQLMITGLLELSNGCVMLQSLSSDGPKLALSSAFLGFGGLCVCLQSHSIANNISMKLYIPGKILHGTLSFLLSYWVQLCFLHDASLWISPFVISSAWLLLLLFSMVIRKFEKPVAFSVALLYNQTSCETRQCSCFFEKRSQNPAPTAFMAQN